MNLVCDCKAADQFVELGLQRGAVSVLGILNNEDHQNVTMVAPVLITICHVSE
jgi:hypothetical protein